MTRRGFFAGLIALFCAPKSNAVEVESHINYYTYSEDWSGPVFCDPKQLARVFHATPIQDEILNLIAEAKN